MNLKGSSGQRYQTEAKAFSSGGEGDIFGIIGVRDKVIKIYHSERTNSELEEKLNTMVKRPPSSTVLSYVAWPLDTVYDDRGEFCGFVMPKLNITADLNEVYTYPPRTNISYKQKLILAQNICVVISEVHRAGFIFGDFNPNNIGINTNTGAVAFLDTDSYHITNGGKTYRCKVCKDGYVAPELIRKCEPYKNDAYASAPLPTFTRETDNFALAIHIFKLLMNGFSPFNGIKETESASTASPGVGNQAIKHDAYCFKPGNKHQSAAVPPLDVLPADIADLFTRAFIYGRDDPKERPSASEWYKALGNYESSLVQCPRDEAHLYKWGLSTCPWCEADERYKVATAPQLKPRSFTAPVQPKPAPSGSYSNSGTVPPPQYGASVATGYKPPSPARATTPAYASPRTSTATKPATVKRPAAAAQGATRASTFLAHVRNIRKKLRLSNTVKKKITKITSVSVLAVLVIGIIMTHQYKQGKYEEAVGFIEQKNYTGAISILDQLGNYKDSADLLTETRDLINEQDYAAAMDLLNTGNYDTAMAAFDALGDYKDSENRYKEAENLKYSSAYADAEEYLQSGDLYSAATAFYALGEYEDARERCFACWSHLTRRDSIAVGYDHVLGVKSNGTVISAGDNDISVHDWSNIVSVAAGGWHFVGLKSDGTVVAVGRNNDGECGVAGWSDIVAIAASTGITVGLRADGTVVAIGDNDYGECDVDSWKNIIAISAGRWFIAGLRADGTVVATGLNGNKQCSNVSDWTDVITIAAAYDETFGIRKDGVALRTQTYGWYKGREDIDNCTDMIDIAGDDPVIGVRRDGTIVCSRKLSNYSKWTNIVRVVGGALGVVGLRSDGTVIAAGEAKIDKIGLDNWKDIMIPN